MYAEDPKDAMLREYLEQIEQLRAQLEAGGEVEEQSEEEETDSSDEEGGAVGWDGTAIKKKKKRVSKTGTGKVRALALGHDFFDAFLFYFSFAIPLSVPVRTCNSPHPSASHQPK